MKVTIFQYRMFHYRHTLFELMRERSSDAGIDLQVVYGQPYREEINKKDTMELDWGVKVKNLYLPIKEKKDLCWQPMPGHLRDSDLVIFMQENRLLANYYWMLKGRLGGPRVAYWGHGKDFQTNAPGGLREKWKDILIDQVDWWFAYTGITVDILQKAGFPEERITCLNNAIDTNGLRHDAENVPESILEEIRSECDLKPEAPMGLFCGSLYPDKKLDLLVEASDFIHQRFPDFRLVVIGDGQSRTDLVKAIESRPWAHWVGVKRGIEKAAYYRLAKFVLNPGAVGLHVLDAFAVSIPMLTTGTAKHGPEIAYLQHGVNGYMTEDSPQSFANAAIELMSDPLVYKKMSEAAHQSGLYYSVENMARNFVDGIEHCLEMPKYKQMRKQDKS